MYQKKRTIKALINLSSLTYKWNKKESYFSKVYTASFVNSRSKSNCTNSSMKKSGKKGTCTQSFGKASSQCTLKLNSLSGRKCAVIRGRSNDIFALSACLKGSVWYHVKKVLSICKSVLKNSTPNESCQHQDSWHCWRIYKPFLNPVTFKLVAIRTLHHKNQTSFKSSCL